MALQVKVRKVHLFMLLFNVHMLFHLKFTIWSPSFLFCFCLVCRDGSCSSSGSSACLNAEIDYVVGPSCTDVASCLGAEIGSVDLSCKDEDSCRGAQLGGVDLINSCNKDSSCKDTDVNGVGVFDELIDCCNDIDEQCKDKEGLDIVNAGCVSYIYSDACQEVNNSHSFLSFI